MELPVYSAGTCPTLIEGRNTGFGSNDRDFDLFVPTSSNGPFAVVFLWHGAGGNAEDFADLLSPYYDKNGFVLVVPDGQRQYDSEWHVEVTPGVEGPAAQEDLTFFDDVLRCIDEQIPIDRRRVHSVGFSVGGRFSAYLMGHRSEVLASFAAWSGGNTTPQMITVVPVPSHAIPGLLYHGGDSDTPACCGMVATEGLASAMVAAGQTTIVCDHSMGHSIPNSRDDVWLYFEAHPFSAGSTAAWSTAVPLELPSYCELRE